MRKLLAITAACALAFTLGACGDDDDDDGAAPPAAETSKVTVKTSEYAYALPTTFTGGLVEITIDNAAGKEPHEIDLAHLADGKTLEDVKAVLESGGAPPDWVTSPGGPGPVDPGKTALWTGNLEEGTYVMICHLPAASDGREHWEHGMLAQVTVSEGESGDLPDADVTIEGKEFAFTGQDGLKAGNQTVKFDNTGEQPHHIAIIAMQPGKGAKELGAFFATTPPSGPPPFAGFPGLISTTDPGEAAVRTLELQAGTTYVLACFIPDAADGKPHSAKGMLAELKL